MSRTGALLHLSWTAGAVAPHMILATLTLDVNQIAKLAARVVVAFAGALS
jgi:hypothetical protein